jgi:uncharacterized protein YdaU (DUF1376 family)
LPRASFTHGAIEGVALSKKQQLHWYARDVEAFERDTAHLDLIEVGAYDRLLDHYYRTKRPLPANAEQLHRICRCTKDAERAAVDRVVAEFFVIDPANQQVIRNARADAEIAKAFAISDKRRDAANSRHNNDEAFEGAIAPALADTPTPTPTGIPPSDKSSGGKRVAAPPPCPFDEIVAIYHETLAAHPQVIELNESRKAMLRARWRELRCAPRRSPTNRSRRSAC